MNEFPKVDVGAKKLFNMVYAPIYTKVLFTGIELNVFSFLNEPRSHVQISEILDLDSNNTRHLLDALASIDLLTKSKGLYLNTEISNCYLVRDSERFIGDLLRTYSRVSGFDEINISSLVKNGPGIAYNNVDDMESDVFMQMLTASQRIGRAYDIAEIVSTLPEFIDFNKMLDLGGGPGLIAIAIVKRHAKMKGVVFESPSIAPIAIESIDEYNMQNRIDVISGDFMIDSIGTGYDFVFSCGSLNFAKHDMDGIINKIYKALNPNGIFMCISDGLVNENTTPKEIVAGWLPSNLAGRDFSLVQGQVSDAALKHGFKSIYKRTIDTLMGELDIDIIRK